MSVRELPSLVPEYLYKADRTEFPWKPGNVVRIEDRVYLVLSIDPRSTSRSIVHATRFQYLIHAINEKGYRVYLETDMSDRTEGEILCHSSYQGQPHDLDEQQAEGTSQTGRLDSK